MTPSRRSIAAELAGFVALAGLASYRWASLIDPPPVRTALVVVAIGCLLAVALVRCGRAGGRVAIWLSSTLAAAIAFAVALLVCGVPADLLLPNHWGELRAELNAGLQGVSLIHVPYGGGDEWTRTGLTLAIPAAVIFAAALSFWPTLSRPGEHGELRPVALAILLTLYGVAVTWEPPGSELAWGVPLMAAVAAWIWLPRITRSRAIGGAVAIVAATLLAVPLAAWADTGEALFDYGEWTIFGGDNPPEFSWDHSYDPLDWPDEGTEVMVVSETRPHFWRTAVLDRFDGTHWFDDPDSDPNSSSGVPGNSAGDSAVRRHQDWIDSPEFKITGMRSESLVTAGSLRWIVPDDLIVKTGRDGTIPIAGDPLEEGDSYALQVYDPNPSPARLRSLTEAMPDGLDDYRTLTLEGADRSSTVTVPQWQPGAGADPAVEGATAGGAYEEVYALARRLTETAPTQYDAVVAVGLYLGSGAYEYTREPESSDDPLPAFLFEARRGYCQQFAGSMALLLRMAGIPTRVAAGFATGRPVSSEAAGTTYSVRDTDAHSWVEVYFPSIGWVTFDPTPAASEARTGTTATRLDRAGANQLFGAGNPTQASLAPDDPGQNAAKDRKKPERRPGERPAQAGGSAAESSDSGSGPVLIVLAVLGAALALTAWNAARRRRRMLAEPGRDRQARELTEALPRLGWDVGPNATLLELERLLGIAGPDATGYVARLRAHRFSSSAALPPGPAERRRLRRALVRGDGIRGLLRGYRVIPPGGP